MDVPHTPSELVILRLWSVLIVGRAFFMLLRCPKNGNNNQKDKPKGTKPKNERNFSKIRSEALERTTYDADLKR